MPPRPDDIPAQVAQVASRTAGDHQLEVAVLAVDRSGRLRSGGRRPTGAATELGLVGEIVRGRWDLVHLEGTAVPTAPLVMAAALMSGTPYFVTLPGWSASTRSHPRLDALRWRLLGPLLRRADRLLVATRFDRSYLAQVTGIGWWHFTVCPATSPRTVEMNARERDRVADDLVSLYRESLGERV